MGGTASFVQSIATILQSIRIGFLETAQSGIVLHGNTTNSTIAENMIYDNKQDQISLQNSADNNLIYNNTLSAGTSGIEIAESSNNNLSVIQSKMPSIMSLYITDPTGNHIESNDINNANNFTLYIRDATILQVISLKNRILTYPTINILLINNTSAFINNTIGNNNTKYELHLMNDSELVLQDNIMFESGGIIKSE